MESIIVNPSYLKPYDFEIFDYKKVEAWMGEHWHYSIYACTIYLFCVFAGQRWMASRKPFELQEPLFWWNVTLSLGSAFMLVRVFPELWNEVKHHGVYHSICNRDERTMTMTFWSLMFTLSKVLEFGDTAFLVLRKKNVAFIHWFHHISVCLTAFFGAGEFDPIVRWYAVLNPFIHFIMYGYFALMALKVKVPKKLAQVVTSLQIIQLIMGTAFTALSLYWKVSGTECCRPYSHIFLTLVLGLVYFFLFAQFFVKAYINNNKKNNNNVNTELDNKPKINKD